MKFHRNFLPTAPHKGPVQALLIHTAYLTNSSRSRLRGAETLSQLPVRGHPRPSPGPREARVCQAECGLADSEAAPGRSAAGPPRSAPPAARLGAEQPRGTHAPGTPPARATPPCATPGGAAERGWDAACRQRRANLATALEKILPARFLILRCNLHSLARPSPRAASPRRCLTAPRARAPPAPGHPSVPGPSCIQAQGREERNLFCT